MFPRALSQLIRAVFLWTAALIFFVMLMALLWAWLRPGTSPKPRPSHVLVSMPSIPCVRTDVDGISPLTLIRMRLHFVWLNASAYALNDGFTPGVVAADGTLVARGTLAVSPDMRAALWQRRLCLRPYPSWLLPNGCGTVRDIMATGYHRAVDIYAPSRLVAELWGRRRVRVSWCG